MLNETCTFNMQFINHDTLHLKNNSSIVKVKTTKKMDKNQNVIFSVCLTCKGDRPRAKHEGKKIIHS